MKLKDSKQKVKDFWHMLGPGLTTGAADDDPAGIATYSQAGAAYGFKFLWVALLTFPFMSMVQEMCARIGLVTGRGLAGVMRHHTSKTVLYISTILLFGANTFNLAADLGVMARAVQLIVPVDFFWLLLGFTVLSLILEIFTTYKEYAKILKWLTLFLFSYVLTGLIVDINWQDALRATFLPSIEWSRNSIILLTAILGTTISPYLFFWQTSQEVEAQIEEGKTTIKSREAVTTTADIRRMRVDVWWGMLLSNLVMFFIIAVCAATLFANGITNIEDASQAAMALKPLAGNFSYILFTLGIVGTGLLAVPVLAGSSSYAISEAFGWREGLYRKFKQAHAFYGVIIVSMLLGMGMNFLGIDTIKMLIYSAVLNGIIAPFTLAIIVKLSSDKKIMKEWVNKPVTQFVGWLITGLMGAASVATLWILFF